jgi:hypothetical protein
LTGIRLKRLNIRNSLIAGSVSCLESPAAALHAFRTRGTPNLHDRVPMVESMVVDSGNTLLAQAPFREVVLLTVVQPRSGLLPEERKG